MEPRNFTNNSSGSPRHNQGVKRKCQVLGEMSSNIESNKNKKSCLKISNRINICVDSVRDNEDDSKKFIVTKTCKLNENKNPNSRMEKIYHEELTPSSTISEYGTTSASIISPLPNLSYINSVQLWNLMLKNDDLYKRDCSRFCSHSTLQPIMRATVLDWLNEVCQAYRLNRQTYYLALDFFDRYLSAKKDLPKQRLQLLGITCLFIAAKIEEIFPPKLNQFSFVCDGACDDAQILKKELVVLHTLKWELHPITPVCWLGAFVKIYTFFEKENLIGIHQAKQASSKQVNESFLIPDSQSELFVRIAHLIDLCTLDADSLAFPYSVIAASAFFHFTNEDVVLQCTGKSMQELQACVKWMVPFAKAIKNSGFDFLNKFENDRAMIQIHTISLELLKNAQSIQAMENETTLDFSDNSSTLCPTTPTKMPLTPPPSTEII